MARQLPEWIGKTDDAKAPPRVRQRVFDAHNGICHISGRRIEAGEPWELEHVVALILGGENRESNLRPALKEHHKAKTATEMAIKAKTDAVRKKHIGAVKPKGSFPKAPKPERTTKQTLPPRQLYQEA